MIKYFIFITATSSLSFAQDFDCPGFLDAKNFTCENTTPSGETNNMILVDFPDGSVINRQKLVQLC